MRRVLVGIAPVRLPGHPKPIDIPSRVGVLFWRSEGQHVVTVIVRATVSFGVLMGDASTIGGFVAPRRFSHPSDEARANDWVPLKDACDILVTGGVDIPAGPSGTIPVHGVVRAPGASVAFTVTSSAAGRAALKAPNLAIAGEGINDLGPSKHQLDPALEEHAFLAGFDYSRFQAAHPRLQSAAVPNGSTLLLQGLGEGATDLTIHLPKLGARAIVEWAHHDAVEDLRMKLDTLHVDLDAEVVDVVWRGAIVAPSNPRTGIDRIMVGFMSDDRVVDDESASASDRYGDALRELARGRFSNAWERQDVVDGREPPPLAPEELEMARYEALATASTPTLTLAEHAQIAAELLEIVASSDAETQTARADVLKQHELDEFQWAIEERAHADRLASVPTDDAGGVHIEYGRLFIEAQERLAPPDEPLPSARDYAAILTRLEVEQPRAALADMKLSLGAWMRIDRRWQRKMNEDLSAATEVDEWLDREEAERGEPPIPEVDDEGRLL